MSERISLLAHRMALIRLLMSKDRMKPFYAHTDMPIWVMFVCNTAIGIEELCAQLRREPDLRLIAALHLMGWQTEAKRWRRQIEADVSMLGQAGAEVGPSRITRLQQLTQYLFVSGSYEDISAYPDVPVAYSGDLMSVTDILRKLSQAFLRISQAIGVAREAFEEKDLCDEAINRYIETPSFKEAVERELDACRSHFALKINHTPTRLLLYLRERLQDLVGDASQDYLCLSLDEQEQMVGQFIQRYFPREQLFPAEEALPSCHSPLAGQELVSKLLCFLDLKANTFPQIDSCAFVQYLVNHDFSDRPQREENLCCLLALLMEMRTLFAKHLRKEDVEPDENPLGMGVYELAAKSNERLRAFLPSHVRLDQLNLLFHRWLVEQAPEEHMEAQQQLCDNLRRGRQLGIKYYLYLLHEAADHHRLFNREDYKEIHASLDWSLFALSPKGEQHAVSTVKKYIGIDSHDAAETEWPDIENFLKTFRK